MPLTWIILGQRDLLRASSNIIYMYSNLIQGGLSIGHDNHIFHIHLAVR
jgi:hypothetical protein